MPPLQVRRVVTGHDENGQAIVQIDEIAKNVISNRPGAQSTVVWTTEGFPVDNTSGPTEDLRQTTLPDGQESRDSASSRGGEPLSSSASGGGPCATCRS